MTIKDYCLLYSVKAKVNPANIIETVEFNPEEVKFIQENKSYINMAYRSSCVRAMRTETFEMFKSIFNRITGKNVNITCRTCSKYQVDMLRELAMYFYGFCDMNGIIHEFTPEDLKSHCKGCENCNCSHLVAKIDTSCPEPKKRGRKKKTDL